MPQIETIYSPALIRYHELDGKTAVIIDVLRATSSMCYALKEGALSITAVAEPEICLTYREKGYLCAAERNGLQLEGFDMGNSPEGFRREKVLGRKIAMTTTNGTHALLECRDAAERVIGSFLNLSALSDYLLKAGNDIVLVCAGWKNKVNIEDTLFAGALAARLYPGFTTECDATIMAMDLWSGHCQNPAGLVEKSSHARRFHRLGIDDLPFCLQQDTAPVVPVLRGEELLVAG